jgi:hypothetical protein
MKQITVMSRNDPDASVKVAEVMGEAGVNIETIDVETVEETTVVVLTVDRYDDALCALQRAGLEALTEDVLLIRVQDQPGSAAVIGKRLRDAGVHLRSLRILRVQNQTAIVAVSVDRTEKAVELLKDVLISEAAYQARLSNHFKTNPGA